MRAILIALEQKELVGLNGTRDAGLDRVEPLGILKSLDTYPDIPAAEWNDKISGWLWVIRPDELPEDWSFTP